MSKPSTVQGYDRVAVALHWSVALLIVAVGAIGLMFGNVLHSTKAFWLNIHAMVGLALFLLVICRTVWRLTQAGPPSHGGGLAALAAKSMHGLLYALMIVIPIVGLVSFVWHGRVLDLGFIRWEPGIAPVKAIYHSTQTVHAWLTYGLIAALALHIGASLWHHFVLRDGRLARMGIGRANPRV